MFFFGPHHQEMKPTVYIPLHAYFCFVWMFVIFRDSVEWDTEQEEAAQQKINENSRVKLGEDQQSILPS